MREKGAVVNHLVVHHHMVFSADLHLYNVLAHIRNEEEYSGRVLQGITPARGTFASRSGNLYLTVIKESALSRTSVTATWYGSQAFGEILLWAMYSATTSVYNTYTGVNGGRGRLSDVEGLQAQSAAAPIVIRNAMRDLLEAEVRS